MKTKQRMGGWLLLLLLCLTACGPRHSYECALPKDAALVVRADFASMAAKSGLNGAVGQPAIRRISDALKSGMEGSSGLIDRIMNRPDESGLDLKTNVYFFAEPQGERGCCIGIAVALDVAKLDFTCIAVHGGLPMPVLVLVLFQRHATADKHFRAAFEVWR